jgi:hypothetical protein
MYVRVDLLADEIAFYDRVGIEFFEKGYGLGHHDSAVQEFVGMVKGAARFRLAKILVHNPVYDVRSAKGFHIDHFAAVESKSLEYVSVPSEKVFTPCGKVGD